MEEIFRYLNKLIEKYNLGSELSNLELNENSLTIIDIPRFIDYIQRAIKGCIQKIEFDMESCSKLLAKKENNVDLMAEKSQALLTTPVKSGKSPANEVMKQFSTPDTASKMSAAKSMLLNVSPTIKEAARLNSEVLKEVSSSL